MVALRRVLAEHDMHVGGVDVHRVVFVNSQVVVGLIFARFCNPDFGVVGLVWEFFAADPPAILTEEDLVTFGIIFAGLWPQIAYCTILCLTGLSNVSVDLIEAGRLDGAKGWNLLRYVALPQLRPATFIAVVVTVIGVIGALGDRVLPAPMSLPGDGAEVIVGVRPQHLSLSVGESPLKVDIRERLGGVAYDYRTPAIEEGPRDGAWY